MPDQGRSIRQRGSAPDGPFRRLQDGQKIDLAHYVADYRERHPGTRMYVGTDSHHRGERTVYATVIVFHHPGRGGHVIYRSWEVPKVRDLFTKLWNEVEASVFTAMELERCGAGKPACIDLDLNPDTRWESNRVLRSALGFTEAMGYRPRCKPFAFSASCVADRICK
jgi:predicted RNase H-related nuclease YkuK (DUF458 family)